MKHAKTALAGLLATSLSIGACCPSIDLFGSTHEVYAMAWATDPWSSRQFESWNDFVELDHQSTALLVAKVEGVPPLPSGSTGEPEPIEWPVRIEWILLKPQGPGTAATDDDGDSIEHRLAEIRWRISATAEADIFRDDSSASSQAFLGLIEATDAEYVWIAPGLGAYLHTEEGGQRIRIDLAQQSIAEVTPEQVESAYEPEVILVTPENENEYDFSTYDYSIDGYLRYAKYVWTNALTIFEANKDEFVERVEPVQKSSYVFRIKPTQ